ncbi:aspartyl-phosphate phosphatase Spo0E family protein [Anaeromonas gelatinilytica]|uniref:aspartyl-phosphate phosphatase Spo0E family protein n=1 Tax=Anaeromonas gelatinilytica TaxID=2683194 RepID=UPI0020784EE0|nr:aspartyl-phosphate phosphatase Spo0E family protein [Anaeromonas gelatinilytica]
MTIDDKITFLRDELNKLLLSNANYDEIYKLSVALDKLITKYYVEHKKNNSTIKS